MLLLMILVKLQVVMVFHPLIYHVLVMTVCLPKPPTLLKLSLHDWRDPRW
jgi:hypothetical protein